MFEYDHSPLSMLTLHQRGIRSAKELEEVIEGHSFADELFSDEFNYSFFRIIGFTKSSKPIKIACRLIDRRIVTLDARIPKVEEIISDFCKYC